MQLAEWIFPYGIGCPVTAKPRIRAAENQLTRGDDRQDGIGRRISCNLKDLTHQIVTPIGASAKDARRIRADRDGPGSCSWRLGEHPVVRIPITDPLPGQSSGICQVFGRVLSTRIRGMRYRQAHRVWEICQALPALGKVRIWHQQGQIAHHGRAWTEFDARNGVGMQRKIHGNTVCACSCGLVDGRVAKKRSHLHLAFLRSDSFAVGKLVQYILWPGDDHPRNSVSRDRVSVKREPSRLPVRPRRLFVLDYFSVLIQRGHIGRGSECREFHLYPGTRERQVNVKFLPTVESGIRRERVHLSAVTVFDSETYALLDPWIGSNSHVEETNALPRMD